MKQALEKNGFESFSPNWNKQVYSKQVSEFIV